MDSNELIPETIDNQLEGMRERTNPGDIRSEDLGMDFDEDEDELGIEVDPITSEEGRPDQIAAVEQVQATWAPGAPETAFDAVLPENDDELITAQSVRAERDPEEYSQDEDLEALEAHSSLDV